MADNENWEGRLELERQLHSLSEIPRDSIKFEPFEMLARLGKEQRVSIRDQTLQSELLNRANISIQKAIANDAFLFGQLTQYMFEALVVSLAGVKLIKQEDVGDIYGSRPDLKVPDFRVILADNSLLLIEVKNFYQRKPFQEFVQTTDYVVALEEYAAANKCLLAFAIYWARWNIWTLVPASRLRTAANTRTISLGEALKVNCAAHLGDINIATRPPLRIVVRSDPSEPVPGQGHAHSRRYPMKINSTEFYSGNILLTDRIDRKIASFFCRYGKWQEQECLTLMDGDILHGIEFKWCPQEPPHQDFAMIGSLSSMFSNWYKERALDDEGKLRHVKFHVTPGFLRSLIPDGYKGKQLPLWVFIQHPNLDDA